MINDSCTSEAWWVFIFVYSMDRTNGRVHETTLNRSLNTNWLKSQWAKYIDWRWSNCWRFYMSLWLHRCSWNEYKTSRMSNESWTKWNRLCASRMKNVAMLRVLNDSQWKWSQAMLCKGNQTRLTWNVSYRQFHFTFNVIFVCHHHGRRRSFSLLS